MKDFQISHSPAAVDPREQKSPEYIESKDHEMAFQPILRLHQRAVKPPPHLPEERGMDQKQGKTKSSPHEPLKLFLVFHW